MNIMVVKAALDFVRGIVRPVSLLAIVGGVVGFLATGRLEEAKYLATFGGPIVGFYFLERKIRHDNGSA